MSLPKNLYIGPVSGDSLRGPPTPAPRVTIIIPTYNRERYLPETIASVLAQSFRDFEVIIVDDGSADSTPALVAAIRDERVRYLAREHRGLSASLNAGLRHARGEYIARLDSDDLLLPDAIAILVTALDENSEFDVVWARARWMTREGRDLPRGRGSPEYFPGDMLRSLVYDDCTTCQAILARGACFDRVGFYDEALAYNEDWDMALRLARHFRFRYVDRIVVRVREHDDSMTGKHSSQRAAFLESRTGPLDKLFREADVPANVAAMKPMAYANVYIFCGRMWLSTRNFGKASREFARAIKVSGRPLSTAIAIGWRVGVIQILERTAAGRRAITALDRLRTRGRT